MSGQQTVYRRWQHERTRGPLAQLPICDRRLGPGPEALPHKGCQPLLYIRGDCFFIEALP
jgi:hypothetical protein